MPGKNPALDLHIDWMCYLICLGLALKKERDNTKVRNVDLKILIDAVKNHFDNPPKQLPLKLKRSKNNKYILKDNKGYYIL